MKKFINNVDTFLNESLSGFSRANSNIIDVSFSPDYIFRKNKPKESKVSLITGGGSGHEPLHGGFVGYGMLDAACPGQVFSAPTPDQIVEASQKVHNEKGILFIVKNYSGDIMNFEMASELLDFENQTIGNVASVETETTQWFVGLQWDELGNGTLGVAMGSRGPQVEDTDENMAYEVFYTYNVNDSMTITPAMFILENNAAGQDDQTGVVVKTSFSF